ncbi:GAF domain-containing sensor histidine kinase [Berryella intestinalis]|uniref:GAF domain-containing sensor histidine kinase n=1 Tax=Berryella intestinalis TaxID=1531429 RepID=UPI00068DCD28|nr:GAF domain-containing sensor histidine kinase [Berryella intestinalis]
MDRQDLAFALKREFGFDFVGVSRVPRGSWQSLSWDYVAGNISDRYLRVHLPEGVGALGMVANSRRALLVGSVERDMQQDIWYQFPIVAAELLESFLCFPLFDDDRLSSIVICAFRTPFNFGQDLVDRVQESAARMTDRGVSARSALTLSGESLTPRYAEITHRIIQAQEDERKRIARELHDGLAQELLLVQIGLRRARTLDAGAKDAALDRACDQLRDAMAHISSLARNLRPAELDELGLGAAVSAECKEYDHYFGVRSSVDICECESLNPDCEVALYRIFQEASLNACKYSGTERIEVALRRAAGSLVLSVRDFGSGFDVGNPEAKGGGLGIAGMRERAAAFGGELVVRSTMGEGTLVEAIMPLDGGGHD